MADLITKNGNLYRWPASINSLKSILKSEGISASIPAKASLPLTIGGYTLLTPEASEKPVGYRVTEVQPIKSGNAWARQWESRDATQDELDNDAAAVRAALKMSGVEFVDVTGSNPEPLMLSAMADDQFGLESVRRKVLAGMEINYRFENGTVVILNAGNFDSLEAVWLPFRASFF